MGGEQHSMSSLCTLLKEGQDAGGGEAGGARRGVAQAGPHKPFQGIWTCFLSRGEEEK